jgi:hypothetical protein
MSPSAPAAARVGFLSGGIMVTMHLTAEVPNDRQLTLTLPEDVPTGPADVVVTVDPRNADRERIRADALEQLMSLAKASTFRSDRIYPTRSELHERD